MTKRRIPVLDKNGKQIGDVSVQATSVGASKIAGAPCQLACRLGVWVWIAKE